MEYTEEELKEFDRLTWMESGDQMNRIVGRLEMRKFIEKHGKEKCEVMFQEILRREKED